MSIDIHTSAPDAAGPKPSSGRSRPVGRTVAVAIAAGAASALGLALGVFPGATEAVTTGSILLAFGFGWGLLAVLSTRRTAQPQRWAAVPAAALTTTGLALMSFQPGNTALTVAGWVWPALMLGLVVWMVVRIRRDLPGRGRWLLTPVVAVLGLASLGATYENIALVHDQSRYPAPGRMVEVNGHRMHLDCSGHGSPTAVLFNGMGEVSASWFRITTAVARTGRVCAFDRAGQGWSDDAEHPQDGVTAAKDLHALLADAGEQGPYVLVGHSIGGTYAMTYAARYPAQVAGMVLLDSSSPQQFSLPAYPGQYALIRRVAGLMPTLDRLGLGRALALVVPSHLPAEASDRVRAVSADAHGARNGRDEASMLHQVFGQAQALTTLEGRPLAVVTASATLADTVGWAAAQARLTALSDNHRHEVVESSHMGLLEDPGPAARSTRAITAVVEAVRRGAPVAPR
jgi:pimeloyl-ACP methyl ester carboxylesterase